VRRSVDGGSAPERLTDPAGAAKWPSDVSPDGTWLVYTENATGSPDVAMLSLDGERRSVALVATAAVERNAVVSPDGRWLAYQSDESGQLEIYVRPFPEVERGRWQVSVAGGTRPLWSPRGDELFYRAPTAALMGVRVEPGTTWSASVPAIILPTMGTGVAPQYVGRTYDVSPDGQRFLLIREPIGPDGQAATPRIVLVQNWFQELQRLVPVN
jgi:serine/threonine-protein kinase